IRDFHVTGVQTCALPISVFGTSKGECLESLVIVDLQVSHKSRYNFHCVLVCLVKSKVEELTIGILFLYRFPNHSRILALFLTGSSEERRVGNESRCPWCS